MEEIMKEVIEKIKAQIEAEREQKWKDLLEGMRIDYLISNEN